MSDDINKSVRDRLAATSEVTAIVKTRIYADVVDQGSPMPALAVQVPVNQAHEDIGGSNRIFQSQVVVLAYADVRSDANALAKVVRDNALAADLRGRIEGMEWQEVSLTSGPNEAVEQPQDGSDKWRRITQQTFTIWNNPV